MESLLQYAGIMASVWIVTGIYIASRFYPNYSHSRQFCSELGAFGSPTQRLSPIINNYPLGLLFGLFGVHLIITAPDSLVTTIIAILILVHGLCTWVCGYFPMDADPYTQTPSKSCKIHSLSGLIMLLTFVIAPAIVVFSDEFSIPLRIVSALCVLGCIFFIYTLKRAFESRSNPGIHQRLSYGCQILWLLVFSLFTLA